MQKILILSLILFFSAKASAQHEETINQPMISQNVELLSIVFRLAGNTEYNDNYFKLYTDRIEKHFSPHRSHPLILFTQTLRKEKGIGYDAVMMMAIHLDDELNPKKNIYRQKPRKKMETSRHT